jgi:hypothetical protein
MLTKESVVAASKDQVSCDMAGEAAILDLESGQYYGLNAIGARIWSLIQEPKTITDVLEILLSEYQVNAEQCESDLLSLLGALYAKGLVKVHEDTPSGRSDLS